MLRLLLIFLACAISTLQANQVEFIFPLKYKGNDPNYFGISNFVDHADDERVVDYTCHAVSYDGHKGTDYFLFPFAWQKVKNNEVWVIAAADGVITAKLDGNPDDSCGEKDAMRDDLEWNMVSVEHTDGSSAIYGHLKKGSLTHKEVGTAVKAGEFLGVVGSSGRSSGPHLHFEVYDKNGHLIDPYSGQCNKKTKRSWWIGHQNHRKGRINLIATHDVEPSIGDCNNKVIKPHLKNLFSPGDQIYFTVYLTNQSPKTKVSYRVVQPSGKVFQYWENEFKQAFDSSYWYQAFTLPKNTELGHWTFMARYQGKTYTHNFTVFDKTKILQKIQ